MMCVHPNGRTDSRYSQRHKLQCFQTTLAFAPIIIWQRHDTNVDLTKVSQLCRRVPLRGFNVDTVDLIGRRPDYSKTKSLTTSQLL